MKSKDRIAEIWKSNINDLLDSLEDPEKMARQFVRDMEEEVDQAAASVAAAVANERRLKREHSGHQARVQEWHRNAEGAIEAGDALTGVTIMQMDAGLDTGAMLYEVRTPITSRTTGGDLHDRKIPLGIAVIGIGCGYVSEHDLSSVRCPVEAASGDGKVTFSDGKTVAWYIDQLGRLGLNPDEEGYSPAQEDLAVFQNELRNVLSKQGL